MSREVSEAQIEQWHKVRNKLIEFKKLEMDLRINICECLAKGKEVGTHNFDTINYNIKVVKKNSVTILKDELGDAIGLMSKDEQECIEYKPSLSLSKYKKLDNHDAIDDCLLVKPASPTLTIQNKQGV